MSISRRKFLKGAILLPAISIGGPAALAATGNLFEGPGKFRRVRPGDPRWPSPERWEGLNAAVKDNLTKIESPFAVCKTPVSSAECDALFKELKNPYYIGDSPALTQTSGWLGAWESEPSIYAVAAKSDADVIAAVNFARENNLRIVIKGGGHSYQGTSNSKDSLLVWTRAMNEILLHDDFVARDCDGRQYPQPAVTVGAGAIWAQVYDAVTTRAGRYVQGGGCATVGVAGLIQSGGFGSFSKNYGLAAAGLLEAEIVTADGNLLVANTCTNPDLFWAIKGGGGGSFGVLTRLTLRTHELPAYFGGASGTIKAHSDSAFREIIARVISLYHEKLFNPHWGEQIIFHTGNSISFSLVFQGLTHGEAEAIWDPFKDALSNASQDFEWISPLMVLALPAQHAWDSGFLKKNAPFLIAGDDRPGAPERNIFWKGDQEQAGQFLYAYHSAWLPASLLHQEQQHKLAEALFAATRSWGVSLHFNKGLAGAPAEKIAAAEDTAANPAVLNAFALAIIAGEGEPSFTGMAGHEPDIKAGRDAAIKINKAMNELLRIVPDAGSYVAESDFFQKNWQQAFWGLNYERLAEVKKKYDPDGLFFVRHGVGSEKWSGDGFARIH